MTDQIFNPANDTYITIRSSGRIEITDEPTPYLDRVAYLEMVS